MTSAAQQADAITSRIGFVVIGRNEGDRLIRCLDSLAAQSAPEIAYVDSGSTDGSVAEAEKRNVHVVRLDLTRPFTAGRARNEGFGALLARAPQLQYVQFVDGDCELASAWLASAQSFLDEQQDVAIACGRRQERNPKASIYNRLCDMEWNTPIGEAAACGGDALVRVLPFAELGGFDDGLIAGEEPELCLRLRANGWKIWRLDSTMTYHDAAMYRFAQWWMRGIRSGFGYAQVWDATRADAESMYGRELLRALIWAGLLPLALLIIALIKPVMALVAFCVYGVQLARIAIRRGVAEPISWAYGFFAVLAKFPELFGAIRFFFQTSRGRASHAILYK